MKIVKGNREFEVSFKHVRYEDGDEVEVILTEGEAQSNGHLGTLPNGTKVIYLRQGKIMNDGKRLEALSVSDEQYNEIKKCVDGLKDKHYMQWEKEEAWKEMGLIGEDDN